MQIGDFEVQRSSDAANFNSIGTVQATAAQSAYSYIDLHPVAGANYYRLLIRTTDGTISYSAIKTITLSSVTGIAVYPIPATTTVNISLGNAAAGVSVRLISQTGQVLQSSATTGGSRVISMNIASYPAGTYFVQIIGENQVLQTTTVVKL
jgi:hypothetical protein